MIDVITILIHTFQLWLPISVPSLVVGFLGAIVVGMPDLVWIFPAGFALASLITSSVFELFQLHQNEKERKNE